MELPDPTRQRVERELAAFCERKVPIHVRDQVRLAFDVEGTDITLFEERPPFGGGACWTRRPITQFRFNDAAAEWSLYCQDQRLRWQRFTRAEPVKAIGALLHVIELDETRIFWG